MRAACRCERSFTCGHCLGQVAYHFTPSSNAEIMARAIAETPSEYIRRTDRERSSNDIPTPKGWNY